MAENEKVLTYVPLPEIKRIKIGVKNPIKQAELLSDIFRINTLYMIEKAGSGHLGTSFSSIDIVTWLMLNELRNPNNPGKNPSDTYFSSKGHDVPALYSILMGLGQLDFENIHRLRRLNGLPGHPDVSIPSLVTNTGSLGMGISTARGIAFVDHLNKHQGRLYVLTGDGELQEGQIWESLQPTANGKYDDITVIVDHNKIQSDTWVERVSSLGNLEKRFAAHGWEVTRCNGHDFAALQKTLARLRKVKGRPQVLIADTIKGKGVSFMERVESDGLYKFHAGAPSYEQYQAAFQELSSRVNERLESLKLRPLELEEVRLPATPSTVKKLVRLTNDYGEEVIEIGKDRKDLIVLDADLIKSCGLIGFAKQFPERFIECGIAEQDMISEAGGIALRGGLPIAHSLACFLSTRPNEQIYKQATEQTKIIYVGSQAGLLPAGPGHSHQSVRDIACLGAVPGLILLEPSNGKETRMGLRWAVYRNNRSTYLRLVSNATDIPFELPKNYQLKVGKGVLLKGGKDAAILSYGPTMLTEAWKAAQILAEDEISLAVINLPWLNRLDDSWLKSVVRKYRTIFTLDDHYLEQGQGAMIATHLAKLGLVTSLVMFGVEEIPACGSNQEVLEYHGLDAKSLAKKIQKNLKRS